MECKICKKRDDETQLFEGVFEEKIESVCEGCARVENIPLIKKPVFEEEKRENLTVRERMERLSNPKKIVPREQFIAHKNLAKLNFPTKREDHPDLVENYDWILKTARRRRKLSQVQLAEELIIPLQVIVDLESGKIAKDFINYLSRLEDFLEVRVRKRTQNLPFVKTSETIQEIVEEESFSEEETPKKENLKRWTLKDIINLGRKKQKEEPKKEEDLEE